MFRRTIVPAIAAVVVLAVPAAAQAAGLTATFSKSSDWGSGFVADYTIKNTGSTTVNGWRLEFDLPAGETITNAWNGVLSSSGTHYVLVNASWNQTIAPGGSVDVGFQGTYSGNFIAPQNCALNGQACVGAPPDTTPPSAPTGLAAGSPTATTIPLHWNASSDNVGVAGYRVYSGSTQVATTTATSATVTGLAPSTGYTFAVRAVDAAGNLSGPSNAVTASTTAAPAGGLTATFAKSDDWGSGFVGGYTIKNNGSTTVNGWRIEFDLPAGASVSNAWNATMTSSGSHYVLTAASWNQVIPAGATASVGFQVAYTTAFAAPQNCLLNRAGLLGRTTGHDAAERSDRADRRRADRDHDLAELESVERQRGRHRVPRVQRRDASGDGDDHEHDRHRTDAVDQLHVHGQSDRRGRQRLRTEQRGHREHDGRRGGRVRIPRHHGLGHPAP